ncbi:PQQ-binding-like beta-propeller repeat protein [Streptomyces sp. NPDC088847]|uniref:PQQ-binding-like beta-propeller repeat protein n=1 Tax=Streptomyces sp. NPDC088847 TaxID=3365909 RepID=UPI003805D123
MSGPSALSGGILHVGTGKAVRPSPTVADGTVYAGDDDERRYAFDAATGEIRWRFRTDVTDSG